MTIYRMDSEEEALFRSSLYAVYYVQSPSTVSHANSAEFRNIHIETLSETSATAAAEKNNLAAEAKESGANRLALSHYSSSGGSTNSFLHNGKKSPYADDLQSQGNHHHDQISNATIDKADHDGFSEEDEECFEGNNLEWRRMFSFSYSDSAGWKILQISWRFIVSMVIALVVLYIFTKPPAPKVSVKISRLRQFELGEGVDATGVATKMLTCNCSVDVAIDNKSKLFGLHVHPPFLSVSFGNLPFAVALGSELKVGVDGVNCQRLYVGTRNKAMYGAGRSMQDLLESKNGLPLAIQVDLRSSFKLLWGLINPKFHHQAHCLIFVADVYDKKHRTQEFISKCTLS